MSLVGFKAKNHPQQVDARGADNAKDGLATDPEFFGALDKRFHFTVDVAASERNTKCERFFDRESDGLAQPWTGETVWCNPPYSTIRPWLEKAWEESPSCPAIVMLLPSNRTEQKWWQELVEPFRDRPGSPLTVEFLPGRLRFIAPDRERVGPNERPPFGCCLLVWASPQLRFASQGRLAT